MGRWVSARNHVRAHWNVQSAIASAAQPPHKVEEKWWDVGWDVGFLHKIEVSDHREVQNTTAVATQGSQEVG